MIQTSINAEDPEVYSDSDLQEDDDMDQVSIDNRITQINEDQRQLEQMLDKRRKDLFRQKKGNCMFLFALETGMALIVILDLAMFCFVIAVCNFNMWVDLEDEKKKDALVANLSHGEFFMFNVTTDYIIVALFLYKLYYGLRLLAHMINAGRMNEDFLMDNIGAYKWEVRVQIISRKILHNYYMASVIFSLMLGLQSMGMIWIFEQHRIVIKLTVYLSYSILGFIYLHRKMAQQLNQMNSFIRNYLYTVSTYQRQKKEREERQAERRLNMSRPKLVGSFNMIANLMKRNIAAKEDLVGIGPSTNSQKDPKKKINLNLELPVTLAPSRQSVASRFIDSARATCNDPEEEKKSQD